MSYERSAVTMARNSKTLTLKPFAMTWVLNTSFQVCIRLPRMVWLLTVNFRQPIVLVIHWFRL
jgi:hypothetical protein